MCLPYLPGGGPWGALTRAIKVYTCEAQLSIKLTGCPHPALLLSEPHEAPENPDPPLTGSRGAAGQPVLNWDQLSVVVESWWL